MFLGIPNLSAIETNQQKYDLVLVHQVQPVPELDFAFSFPVALQASSDEINITDLNAENLSSTIDKILQKYGQQFPHLEQARSKGFKYIIYSDSDPRFPETFKNLMKTARAATNPGAREILFNVENISNYAAQTGRSLEKQLVLTLSNEACHVLWGTSVKTRTEEESKIELDEVYARHIAKDQNPTKLETDIIDRVYDEYISSIVMRITEICLESHDKRIKFEQFVRDEKSFLDSTLSSHIDSGFFGVFNIQTLTRLAEVYRSNQDSDEKTKFAALVVRINSTASSASFGQRFVDGIKKANLPIDFEGRDFRINLD